MTNKVTFFLLIWCFILSLVLIQNYKKPEKKIDQWELKSYQYVLTLQDSNWIEIRHANGTIVGQVQVDTSTTLGKLFYKDNE